MTKTDVEKGQVTQSWRQLLGLLVVAAAIPTTISTWVTPNVVEKAGEKFALKEVVQATFERTKELADRVESKVDKMVTQDQFKVVSEKVDQMVTQKQFESMERRFERFENKMSELESAVRGASTASDKR